MNPIDNEKVVAESNEIFLKAWNKRKTARVVHFQSGLTEHQDRVFSAFDPEVGQGRVVREGDAKEADPAYKSDITGAINYMQKALGKAAGNLNVSQAIETMLKVASALVKIPDGMLIRKAQVNQGSTRPPLRVEDNRASRTGGPAVINISEFESKADRLAAKHAALRRP